MSRRAAKPLPTPAGGVCTPSLPEPLPDEPAVLKALLRAQQHAFAAREIAHRAALEAREAELPIAPPRLSKSKAAGRTGGAPLKLMAEIRMVK